MELIIFVGIQACGKSTFFKQQFFDTHVRINLDTLQTRYREKYLFQACLESKTKIVIDNTNPLKVDRLVYIEPAKRAGYEIICYHFLSNVKDAILRNKQRTRKVPDVAIYSTAKKLQPPTYSEGFNKIFSVSDDSFNISLIQS